MSMIVGERVKVLVASDVAQIGTQGEVVLESAKTIMIWDSGRIKRVQKTGTLLQLEGGRRVVQGDELSGRLEDRLARSTRR